MATNGGKKFNKTVKFQLARPDPDLLLSSMLSAWSMMGFLPPEARFTRRKRKVFLDR
jgi:hypothetical protein